MTPHFHGGGSANVDSVDVSTFDTGYWLMDNVTFNANAAVPEPAGIVLMATLLGGVAWSRLRRKK